MSHESFEDAYFTLNAWYNNLGEEEYDGIIEWLDGLKRKEDGSCYASILDVRDRFPESVELLQIMVIMFGDYGTSPRSGWIEEPEAAAAWLRAHRKHWEEP